MKRKTKGEMKDFYLRASVAREKRKLAWDLRMEENRGRTCTFAI